MTHKTLWEIKCTSELSQDHKIIYFNLSDDRLKINEKFITNALNSIMKLRPQTYNKYTELLDTSSNTVIPDFDRPRCPILMAIVRDIMYNLYLCLE